MHATALAADPAILYWNAANRRGESTPRAACGARHRRLLHDIDAGPAGQAAVRRDRRRRRRAAMPTCPGVCARSRRRRAGARLVDARVGDARATRGDPAGARAGSAS